MNFIIANAHQLRQGSMFITCPSICTRMTFFFILVTPLNHHKPATFLVQVFYPYYFLHGSRFGSNPQQATLHFYFATCLPTHFSFVGPRSMACGKKMYVVKNSLCALVISSLMGKNKGRLSAYNVCGALVKKPIV